jgi:hypothetical protein
MPELQGGMNVLVINYMVMQNLAFCFQETTMDTQKTKTRDLHQD